MKYLEVVDAMVGQLLRRLADAAAAGASSAQQPLQPAARQPSADSGPAPFGNAAAPAADTGAAGFAVCVTGDHSTPVVFGDHSHEAVPFVVARVADAVRGSGSKAVTDCSVYKG